MESKMNDNQPYTRNRGPYLKRPSFGSALRNNVFEKDERFDRHSFRQPIRHDVGGGNSNYGVHDAEDAKAQAVLISAKNCLFISSARSAFPARKIADG